MNKIKNYCPTLSKLYNKPFDFEYIENLSSKDIIHFLRNSLSDHSVKENSKNNPNYIKQIEEDILSLLKLKTNTDYWATNIDDNIILTFCIRNNAFNVLNYLLNDLKIYDLTQHHESLNHSIGSCVSLYGEKMFDLLINYPNIHIENLFDLCLNSNSLASSSKREPYKTLFNYMAQTVNNKISEYPDFTNKIIHKILELEQLYKEENIFCFFLKTFHSKQTFTEIYQKIINFELYFQNLCYSKHPNYHPDYIKHIFPSRISFQKELDKYSLAAKLEQIENDTAIKSNKI